MRWALERAPKVFFVPDRHLGEVACWQLGIPPQEQFLWGGGLEGMQQRVHDLNANDRARLDAARVVLWGSYCGVHTVFSTEMVEYWKREGYRVLVHPECKLEVVQAADGAGSTKYLWTAVKNAEPGSKLAIATEGHFVRNARELARGRDVEVVHMAEVPDAEALGCGCATMSRNDPPHLVGMLDLLRQGKAPDANRVEVGDVVDEITGRRERLSPEEQERVRRDARLALERMVEITRAAER